MGFKVDDEYYDAAIDYYKNQVSKIQECLDQFITTCNSLFICNLIHNCCITIKNTGVFRSIYNNM